MTTKTAGDFYLRRVNVETDIANIKVRLRGEKLNEKCADIVQKEHAIIILHYQLLAAVRMKAAKLRNLPPRKLSSTETRVCVRNYFERSAGKAKLTVRALFVTAIKLASKCRIPDRPGRSFKRVLPQTTSLRQFLKTASSASGESHAREGKTLLNRELQHHWAEAPPLRSTPRCPRCSSWQKQSLKCMLPIW